MIASAGKAGRPVMFFLDIRIKFLYIKKTYGGKIAVTWWKCGEKRWERGLEALERVSERGEYKKRGASTGTFAVSCHPGHEVGLDK